MRIAFLYDALNALGIFSCDISNAYLEAPCGEKLWTVAEIEFGSLDGTTIQNNRTLYALKYAGNSWHKDLYITLSYMNFEPSRADPDICLRMSNNSR